ncbi:hypothetical protein WISP_110779 [Willisornis vidua]|uniref:Uncharacterized protein n=1 Tax=Willisornis vidua TaxID=1566151 RepID=A0ABQ9CVT0_9PASS|nr:hypothetical protein WISP_110779 [Willisornis vidua]
MPPMPPYMSNKLVHMVGTNGILVLFSSEQLTSKGGNGKKECLGHMDDMIGLESVRFGYITENYSPRPVCEHGYGKVALSFDCEFPGMGINFENERVMLKTDFLT